MLGFRLFQEKYPNQSCFVMLRYFLVLLILAVFLRQLQAQTPTNQDCLGAIPICEQSYDEPDPYAYAGEGNYLNEINDYAECLTTESNGLWYIFTAQTSGLLRFSIVPHDSLDDYDWVVFDMTGASCNDFATHAQDFMLSSNTYGATTVNDSLVSNFTASTGINSEYSGGQAGNCNGPGAENGPPWNDDVPVEQGKTYLIYISNWSGSDKGYFIDFGASTAVIYDTEPPRLSAVSLVPECGQNNLHIQFSENISCQSFEIADLQLSSPQGIVPLSAISSPDCNVGAENSRDFVVQSQQPFLPGTYTLSLIREVNDACFNVSEVSTLEFELGAEIDNVQTKPIDCYGQAQGSISIQAQGGHGNLSYSIDGGNSFATHGNFQNLAAGEYFLAVKDEKNCIVYGDTIALDQPPEIVFETQQYTHIQGCYGDQTGSITLDATGGTGSLSYSIDGGNSFAQNGSFQNLPAGNYPVVATDGNNCRKQGETIRLEQPPDIEFHEIQTTDVNSCDGIDNGSISLQASGGTGQILFSLDSLTFVENGQFENLAKGIYRIFAKDQHDCLKSIAIEIDANFGDCIQPPNAFTPNSDGTNDRWEIDYIWLFPQARIEIYDRWGKLLAAYKGSENGWDGSYRGKKMPTDTYYYLIFLEPGTPPLKGQVSIVR